MNREPRDSDATLNERKRPLAGTIGATNEMASGGDATASIGPAGDSSEASSWAIPGYQLGERIGRGGMGTVYRAWDVALQRDVAVKFLNEDYAPDGPAAHRFLDEARITGQLQHPAIPPVHEVGQLPDGRPYMVMKLIKGRTLASLLTEGGDDRGRLVAVFEQLCHAVGYAHANQVIHRDLKPQNVMVGAFGEVQVMDWGLAKVLSIRQDIDAGAATAEIAGTATDARTRREPDSATQAGSVLGTPAYMPPEQAGGEVERIDLRSDVFGLGAVLCAILTGKAPYVAKDADAIRLMAIRGQLAPAFARLNRCGAEPALIELCQRCLAPEPDARPRDAGAVAQAIGQLRAEADARATQAELDRVRSEGDRLAAEVKSREEGKRRRTRAALALTVGLMLVGLAGFAWWQDRQAGFRRTDLELRRLEDDHRATIERERLSRNADAVAGLLERCESALRDDDAARAAVNLNEAEGRAAEGGADDSNARLLRCRADFAMLRELDRIENLAATWVESAFQSDRALAAIPAAFRGFGVAVGETSPDEVAHRLNESLIRERLLTALDYWFTLEVDGRLRTAMLAVLNTADPDSFRHEFRSASAARKHDRMRALVESSRARQQPPRFAVVIGRCNIIAPPRREQVLRGVLLRQPGNFHVLMALANLHPMTDDGLADRLGWYRAAVVARPANPMVWNNLGAVCMSRNDLTGAVDHFREAVRVDPGYHIAHINLALALGKLGDADGSIASYRDALRLEPRYHAGHSNLGAKLMAKGDHDGAIRHFNEAIALDPKYAPAHYNLSAALAMKGRLIDSAKALNEAMRLDPGLKVATKFLDRMRPKKD